jgi:hypothetical protein
VRPHLSLPCAAIFVCFMCVVCVVCVACVVCVVSDWSRRPVRSFGLCLHNADLPEGKGWHDSFGNLMEIKMRAISGTTAKLRLPRDPSAKDYSLNIYASLYSFYMFFLYSFI